MVNSQKQCYTPDAPETCGVNVITQCLCVNGCRTGGKCPPCTRTPGAAQDSGCPPVGTPLCQVDPTDFMNNRCVVSEVGHGTAHVEHLKHKLCA